MDLYLERGFEQTTVAEIAARAGLTERTFFRHFADKKEVLFGGTPFLQESILKAVTEAPETATPLEAVISGFEAAGMYFKDSNERSRRRQTIIDAHPELQARELSKLATLTATISEALQQRGVAAPAAELAAQAGMVVFKTAFERWVRADRMPDWKNLIHTSLKELRFVVSGH